MTLTPVKLSPQCCCHMGELISATDLCCARGWIRGAGVGNGSVRSDEENTVKDRDDTP